MPDEINVDEQSGIIHVRSYGILTKNDVLDSIRQMSQINTEMNINKVFIDTREQEKLLNVLDIYEIFTKFPKHIFVALLAEEDQKTFPNVSFTETFCQNRGLKVKMFFSKDAAMEWLGKANKSINMLDAG